MKSGSKADKRFKNLPKFKKFKNKKFKNLRYIKVTKDCIFSTPSTKKFLNIVKSLLSKL